MIADVLSLTDVGAWVRVVRRYLGLGVLEAIDHSCCRGFGKVSVQTEFRHAHRGCRDLLPR